MLPRPRHVPRAALPPAFLLLLALALTALLPACARRSLLDTEISARDSADFERWIDRYHDRLPPEIREEFDKAFLVISQLTPGRLRAASVYAKIHGRTVRQFIVDGYDVANRSLQFSMSNELDNIQRNLTRSAKPDLSPADTETLEKLIRRETQMVEAIKVQIAANQARAAEFAK